MNNNFSIADIKGVIPALVTMFDESENVDENGLRQLVSMLSEKGVNGFYLNGSTGEGFLMNTSERKRVAEIVVDENKNRVPVIVHIGAIGTKLSIELAEHAQEIGADAISSVPPFYWQFSKKQIVQYYRDISDACDLPMIVYNVQLSGLLDLDTIYQLAQIKNVGGIKFTSTAQFQIAQIKNELGKEFRVYSGVDEMAISALIAGVDGLIGSFYNVLPEIYLSLVKAVTHNKMEEASRLQNIASLIIAKTLQLAGVQSGIKAILSWMGIGGAHCRRPFLTLNQQEKIALRDALLHLKETRSITEVDFYEFL